jgi:hypothetical protein
MSDTTDQQAAGSGRDETELERRDRQFDDLLQELRVAQTGVQVLFAFLLGVPFTQRFTMLDRDQRLLYLVVLLASAAAILCLLAPGAWHRALFARGDKAHLVRVSHHFAIFGLFFVALAVCGVVTLIATVLYPGWPAAVIAAGGGVLFTLAWFALPVARRLRLGREEG